MTNEEKQLLILDLCERLLYKVKVSVKHKNRYFDDVVDNLTGVLYAVYPDEERIIVDELDKAIAPVNVRCGGFRLEESEAKPFLRPMSSMTKKEKEFYNSMFFEIEGDYMAMFPTAVIDWLNSHYFEYRGLIERGLALIAPKGMYG